MILNVLLFLILYFLIGLCMMMVVGETDTKHHKKAMVASFLFGPIVFIGIILWSFVYVIYIIIDEIQLMWNK